MYKVAQLRDQLDRAGLMVAEEEGVWTSSR